MAMERKSGKACIEFAKKLAKAHGVDVLGWNDKPGKEFVSVNGDGDKLLLLQKAMEAEGWYTWPMKDEQDDCFMDFGMTPPPPELKVKPVLKKVVPDVIYDGTDFYYSGLSSGSVDTYVLCSVLLIIGVLIAFWGKGPNIIIWIILQHALVILSTAVFIGFLTALDWIFVFADQSKITIRKLLFGREKNVELSNIKRIRLYTQKKFMDSAECTFVAVDLKAGKSFDLFLPKKARENLVAFVKTRIPS